MTDKLIIHAGFPKTGTTSLQASLAAARSALLEQGIHYPKRHGSAQHDAAWALTERVFGWEGRGGTKTPITAWNSLVEEVKSTKETVLISSEFLSHAKPLQVERIQKDLNVKDTTIVFTLRAIAKILPSRYQQSLKKGNTWGYHEWLRNVLQLDGSGESPQIKFGNYSNLVERWANVFGAQNVVVVIVDESTPNLIFDAFHEILNLKPDSIVKVKDSALNRSLTTEETVLLAALNESFKNEGSWKEYSTFVRNHIVKSWSGREASQDHTKIHTPEWAIDKAVEIAERNVAHLKELNVKVLGDLEHLASRNVLIGDTSESSVIPARLASETLLNLQRRFAKRLQRRDDRIKRLLAQKRPLYKVILRRFKK